HAAARQDSEGRDRAAQGPRDSARSVGTRHHRGAGVNRVVTFFKTIFVVDLLKGLWVTLKYTPQPAFTFQYPAERRPTAPRFRGLLRLQTEPGTGAQTCIVCDQCAKACPDDLIALGGHREPGQKIKILDYFDFNLSRCSFCGLCAEVCPTKPIKALIMSEDYELGSYSRDMQIQLGKLVFTEGRFPESLDAYQHALRTDDTSRLREARSGVIQSALRLAEYDIARVQAEALLKSSPHNAEAVSLYGDSLWASGLFEQAEEKYKHALSMVPDLARGRHGLARSLLARRQVDAATNEA